MESTKEHRAAVPNDVSESDALGECAPSLKDAVLCWVEVTYQDQETRKLSKLEWNQWKPLLERELRNGRVTLTFFTSQGNITFS